MSEEQKKQNKKVSDLLSKLNSKEEKEVLSSVKGLKNHGNETVIEPLVAVFCSTDSEKVKAEITDLLNTIKSTKVPAEVAKCLNNTEYVAARHTLMISIWSTGLDYNAYMSEIAQATVNGELMEAIECITILENLDKGLDEDEIMDALLIFKTYLVETKDENSPKNDIIKDIVILLQQMNDSV